MDWVPVLSQVKSLVQVCLGDAEGAARTQDNFSKQCPGVSQMRSAVEATFISGEAASQTQMEFLGFLMGDATVAAPKKMHNPEKSQEKLKAEAREKLGMDVVNHINYAFVGQSGTGKSSIINALRGIADDDAEYAAKVGETETTTDIKKYCHPGKPHILLWDIPGAGTLAHPAETYFEDKMLYAFDSIVILSSSRFMEIDFTIASKANKFRTPCAFVRTKADEAVKAKQKRDRRMTMEEASRVFRKEVEESFAQGLKAASGLPHNGIHRLFIVSAWGFDETKEAYVVARPDRTFDESLKRMDESLLSHFLCDAIRIRCGTVVNKHPK